MRKVFCLFFCLLFVSPVLAQGVMDSQTRALIDRIDRLERDLTLLQRKLYKSGNELKENESQNVPSFPAGSAEHLYSKISELEQVVAHLTAQVEEKGASLEALDEKVKKINQDIDFRLGSLEKAFEELPSKTLEQTPKEQPKTDSSIKNVVVTQVNPADAQKDYDAAYSLLKKGEYVQAEESLKKFLENYPSDKLSGNAQYWLGETYYVRGLYEQAAVTFAQGVQKYKASSKGADSLLKLGMSLARLNKTKEACTAFKNLNKEFPNASASLKARAQNEMEKLSCPVN